MIPSQDAIAGLVSFLALAVKSPCSCNGVGMIFPGVGFHKRYRMKRLREDSRDDLS